MVLFVLHQRSRSTPKLGFIGKLRTCWNMEEVPQGFFAKLSVLNFLYEKDFKVLDDSETGPCNIRTLNIFLESSSTENLLKWQVVVGWPEPRSDFGWIYKDCNGKIYSESETICCRVLEVPPKNRPINVCVINKGNAIWPLFCHQVIFPVSSPSLKDFS